MSPWRRGAGLLLTGLLASCQTSDNPGFLVRAGQSIEAARQQVSRDVAERTEGLMAMGAALTGCSLDRRKGYELDPEREDALGRAVTDRQLTLLGVQPLPTTDPVARYVDQVGQYLALVAESVGNANAPDRADRPEKLLDNRAWPLAGYRFLVLPLEEPRATGNPGGAVMITTGFLRSLQSEEELAAVLVHEVVHVQRGHGVEALKAFMCQYEARQQSSAALRVFGRGPQSTRSDEQLGAAEEAANLYREGFPKDFELEADRISIRILMAAGYDGRAFSELLRRISRQPPAQHAWLRMHPPPSERLTTVGERLKEVVSARSWPSAEAVAPRTRRFLEAVAPLNAPADPQAAR
jgi:predicted Zn-dependent protease